MIIDENESAKPQAEDIKDQDPNSYMPSDEDKKTLRLVEKIFQKNKRWRSQYDKRWMDYYKIFRGQQWLEQRPSYRHSEVINLVFQAIQSSVPIITDTRPKWEYQPQNPSDKEFADIMNDVAEADWTKNNWLMSLTETVYDSNFYGTGFSYMCHDPKAKPMEGDIDFGSFDPFSFYPDPPARDVNKKCRNIVTAEPIEIDEIKREYPELGKFVKPDIVDAIRNEKTELEPIFQLRLPIDETKSMRDSGHNMESLLDQKCLKKTVYMLSDEKVDGVDPATGQPTKVLKYPNGRKIVSAGGVLLENGPNPYDDQKFPFAKLLNYMLPREFWGISEVEQLESPQKIFNKLISFALDVLTLMGNPIWIVDDEAGIDTDNLINSPGLIVEKNKGGEVRREEGVQLQPYVLQLVDRMKEWFDGVAGTHDTSPPPGVTAAAAIADIQEAALTRSRLKSRLLDAYLQDSGQMYLSRVLQFRDVPTIVRLTDDQGATKYFKFHVQQQMDPMGQPMMDDAGNPMRTAVVQHLGPDGGVMEGGYKEIPIKGNLDVKVSTQSALPFMKAAKARQAQDLFDRQAIDQEELLKAVEWPNYQVVIDRMNQKAMMAQQQQQQMDQQAMQAKAMASQAPKV